MRTRKQHLMYEIDTAKKLAAQWHAGNWKWEAGTWKWEWEADTWKPWQKNLLHAYWNGSLQQQLQQISSADPMCRMPYEDLTTWQNV